MPIHELIMGIHNAVMDVRLEGIHSWPLISLCIPGGALRVKISRGARLEVQNGTQQDLNEIIDLVNLGGKKIVYMLKMGGFEMGPNKIWIKW